MKFMHSRRYLGIIISSDVHVLFILEEHFKPVSLVVTNCKLIMQPP